MRKYKDEDLVRLYLKGLSYREIGAELGVAHTGVAQRVRWLIQKGVKLPSKTSFRLDVVGLNKIITEGKR